MSTDIIIITGKINSGKTTACKTWINRQKSAGKSPGGILSLPVWRQGEKNTYYAYDISTEEAALLATTAAVSAACIYGRFRFPCSGLAFAESVIRKAAGLTGEAPQDAVVIDEIGPLELQGEGFAPVVKEVLRSYGGTLLFTVRETHLDKICSYFGIQVQKDMVISPEKEAET